MNSADSRRQFIKYPLVQLYADVIENDSEATPGGWADPPVVHRKTFEQQRVSYELEAMGESWGWQDGRPLNPRGRTGMCERGLLGKWGPNHAADPIVTRFNPNGGKLQFVAIKRKDTGEWALPGGMQDPGEVGIQTLK